MVFVPCHLRHTASVLSICIWPALLEAHWRPFGAIWALQITREGGGGDVMQWDDNDGIFHLRVEVRVVQSLCGVSVNCFQLFSACLRIRHRTDKFTICKHYTFQLFACICNRITYGCHSRDSTPLTLQSRVASHQPCHVLSANTGEETIK